MLKRLERIDQAIIESEQMIVEQVFRILAMEAEGRDTGEARRTLRAFEGILVESRRVRSLLMESRSAMEEPSAP